ncbi:MAG TPA: hypothetical protein DEH78_06770 [Solibacterales bacterium]|nr:hypothetical protein [Bryobacterales bacterium]
MTPIGRNTPRTSWWDGLSVRWVWLTIPLAALSIYFGASLLRTASELRSRIDRTSQATQLLAAIRDAEDRVRVEQLKALEPRLAPELDRRDLQQAAHVLAQIEREQVAELHAKWDKVWWLLVLFMALAVVPILLATSHRIESRRWRAVEAALRDSEARFRELFDNVIEGVYQSSPDGTILSANAALIRMLGFESERELKRVNVGRTLYVHAADRERVMEKMRRDGEVRNEELTLRRKDGRQITVLENARLVTNGQGRALYFEGTLTDITDRKLAERDRMQYTRELEEARLRLEEQAQQLLAQSVELREARDAALQASRLKSEFVANVSHEFRTPMNGVIGMANLLLEGELSIDQRDRILTIRDSGEALLTLLNDILDLSKIEAGRMDFEDIEFQLRRTIEDVVELLSVRAAAKGLELVSEVDPEVPELMRADSLRLRQVLTNLLGNAIKFTESGEVEVSVRVAERTGEMVTLRFDVRDTGIGISDEARSRLFKPFSQADGSTSRRYGGSGLGLAISRQLIERMGGAIGLESAPGAGSRFWFTLPVIARADVSEVSRKALAGRRVLLVERNATARSALARLVSSWGAAVEPAAGSGEAMERLQSGEAFDTVIVATPDTATAAAYARLGQHQPAWRRMSRLLLAPRSFPGTAQGFDRVLHKPVRESALRCALAEMRWPQPTEAHSLARLSRQASQEPRPLAGRGPILLAEDNLVNQRVAVGLLAKLGIDVDVVSNGAEALAALDRMRYRLILMDCQMPELDGFQATALIRAKPGPNSRIPIIALTANAMQSDRDRCLAAGMDDYLSKPVNPKRLAELLERWLPVPTLRMPASLVRAAAERAAGA